MLVNIKSQLPQNAIRVFPARTNWTPTDDMAFVGDPPLFRPGSADFCELQGLPRDFDLPGWSTKFKYRAVGNGVPIPMGQAIARAIVTARCRDDLAGSQIRLCACDCGRAVSGRAVTATPACRKRMQRRRECAGAIQPRQVTETSYPPAPPKAEQYGFFPERFEVKGFTRP